MARLSLRHGFEHGSSKQATAVPLPTHSTFLSTPCVSWCHTPLQIALLYRSFSSELDFEVLPLRSAQDSMTEAL